MNERPPRFTDMLPETKLSDARFMRMANAIADAIENFEDEGGDYKEIPMTCAVVIVFQALASEDPKALVDATYTLMLMPIEQLNQ